MSIYLIQHITNTKTAVNLAVTFYASLKRTYSSNLINCWVNTKKNSVFYLLKSSNKKMIKQMYFKSFNLKPYKISVVNNHLVYAFLKSEQKLKLVQSENNNFSTILIAKKVDDKVSYFKKNICKKSIFKNLVYSYNGSLYENNENNLVAFFDSNKKAIECAFSIKTALSKRTDSSFFKIITYRFPQKKNESSIVITISILLLLLHFVKTQKQLIVLTNKQRIVNYLNDDEFINKKEIHLLEPYEESFLFSLMNTLSGNYQNPKFNITNICAIMMMCKTKLYRNCKKITGKSLNQILKEFRLLKAVNSLSICRSTVNEISIDVGFGSSSYFSKCFKKKFGIPPKKILKN